MVKVVRQSPPKRPVPRSTPTGIKLIPNWFSSRPPLVTAALDSSRTSLDSHLVSKTLSFSSVDASFRSFLSIFLTCLLKCFPLDLRSFPFSIKEWMKRVMKLLHHCCSFLSAFTRARLLIVNAVNRNFFSLIRRRAVRVNTFKSGEK